MGKSEEMSPQSMAVSIIQSGPEQFTAMMALGSLHLGEKPITTPALLAGLRGQNVFQPNPKHNLQEFAKAGIVEAIDDNDHWELTEYGHLVYIALTIAIGEDGLAKDAPVAEENYD